MKKVERVILNPELNDNIKLSDVEDSDVVEDAIFLKQERLKPLYGAEFRHTKFQNVDFTAAEIERISLIHVVFDHCDLSNIDLSNATIHHVEFHHCKLVGTDFSRSSIKHLIITDSILSFSNFNLSNIDYMEAIDTDMSESSWNEVMLKHTFFTEVNFTRTEFLHTSLKDIDMSFCILNGIIVDIPSLYGMIIDDTQAIDLIGLLGVKRKESR